MSKEDDLERYHRIRGELIQLLGGFCAKCGSLENLQFDHIDYSTKSFEIGSNMFRPRSILIEELSKCQLLCKPCHDEKSQAEHSIRMQGETNSFGKLRELDIKYIRELYRIGHSTYSIAEEFGISRIHTGDIIKGKIWGWFEPENITGIRKPGRPRSS